MDLQRNDGSEILIDDRVSADGHYGTVRFIGSLPDTKGIWIGVDWDEAERGKHDGSHQGHRYFTTRHPKSGSFLRGKKLDLGINCFEAIVDRYGKQEDHNAGVITEELFVVGSNQKKTVVEMVGAKKVNEQQSKLDALQEVVLRGCLVYGVGDSSGKLRKCTPNIQELDLSLNLIPSWHRLADICKCLPNLTDLNASDNQLEMPKDILECSDCFQSVKILKLNRVNYIWQQFLECSRAFPRLEQLHVCFNGLTSVHNPGNHLQNVHLLNLESNSLQSWEHILQLDGCPRLESLILNSNKIESIIFPDANLGSKTKFFPNLKHIYINNNEISQWSCINELDKLKRFEDLQINGNPIQDTASPETVRQLIIAKVANLKKCQRTEVTDEERRGAEIDYLKRFGPDWLKSGGHQDPSQNNPSQDFLSQHPRFQHFVQVYGAPESSEMSKKPQKLKDSLIEIKILNPDDSNIKTLQKKLPVTMTVQKLKALIQRLYKVDSEIKLSYVSKKMEGCEIDFDNDLRPLNYFSIEAGDIVYARWS
ncbi:tubulin-specific chaperone E-like [Saccostrea cucullata]|uniref:tubulin-specific chaperone E-like n=1 Tax=Saccostrea cuccullata TaxID=36930 RepID=UPI002ED697DF